MLVPTRVLRASWSNTLRLPKSLFPARPRLTDRPRYLEQCTDNLYEWQHNAPNSCASATDPFILHDGPPYANGSLHIGHALNKILKDITCRFQLSQGKRVNYVPGWDCHGLPIELKALQKQREEGGLAEDERLGAVEVRKIARELATRTVKEQKNEFRKWAIMADWAHAWKTMDKSFEICQLRVFRTMVEQNLIYRQFKPVYWSPSSQTALAEAELEYNSEHISTATFVKFPLLKLPSTLQQRIGHDGTQISAVIWTTTPWTLPANKAIAVHEEMDYVVVNSQKHGPLLLAASRTADIEAVCDEAFGTPLYGAIQGAELVGTTYRHPAYDEQTQYQQVLHAPFVSADSGSGLVHIAPGHGMDDYKLCQQLGIAATAPVDDCGCFTKDALPTNPEILVGQAVLQEGNNSILDYLQKRKAILGSHQYRHNYPYDWRSKQPVIIRATEQWFADVGEIRESALESLNAVRFIPETGKERLSSFIRNRSEWCISRQRAWGVPIPALYRKDTGASLLTPASITYIISVMEDRGIDAWWTDNEFDPVWVLPELRKECEYRRGTDTMDVWFDSGTSWTQMMDGNHSSIAHLYIEGTDQHRGWFQSSLLTKIASQASSKTQRSHFAPYRTLITHGFTLDQYGKKMSKSIGNVITPDEVMNGTLLPPMNRKNAKGESKISDHTLTYDGMGPDALRLWVANCDYTKDVIVGQPVLKALNASLSKLRVTFKLLLGMLDTHEANQLVHFDGLGTIDQIALLQLSDLDNNVRRAYQDFEYHKAISAINQYVITELSAFYIESIKDRIYADAIASKSRIHAQIVVWEIFKKLSYMLAPMTPLLIQEACDYLPEGRSFDPVKDSWNTHGPPVCVDGAWENQQLESDLKYLTAANSSIKIAQELARADKKMGSSLQSFVILDLSGSKDQAAIRAVEVFNKHASALEDFFVVSKVDVISGSLPSKVDRAAWSYSAEFEVHGARIKALVYEPQRSKCPRCWKYNVSLKDDKPEESLCPRCTDVVAGLEMQSGTTCRIER
ncbi:isoleucine-tRNA ligase [Xylographa carneopallida]|nr:isoleucine-tRNA ligase [Xylographa carneopallida]